MYWTKLVPCVLTVVSLTAFSALGQAAAPSAANSKGLLSFDNVRVVNAPSPAKSTPIPAGSLQKATVDKAGRITSVADPDDENKLDEQIKDRMGRRVAAPVQVVRHASGMVSATLDESFMNYAVATIDANGKLTFQCAAGKSVPAAPKKEAANVR